MFKKMPSKGLKKLHSCSSQPISKTGSPKKFTMVYRNNDKISQQSSNLSICSSHGRNVTNFTQNKLNNYTKTGQGEITESSLFVQVQTPLQTQNHMDKFLFEENTCE